MQSVEQIASGRTFLEILIVFVIVPALSAALYHVCKTQVEKDKTK